MDILKIGDTAKRIDNGRTIRVVDARPNDHDGRTFWVYITEDVQDGHTTIISHDQLRPLNPTAADMGRQGGRARSAAKTAASRANGARGGRPRTEQTIAAQIIELHHGIAADRQERIALLAVDLATLIIGGK